MDNYTDKKPKTVAGSEFDQTKSKSTLGSNSTLTYIVVALVLIFGALLLFTNNWGTTTPIPTATQDSTTPPAPDAMAPATPPAAESTTPPATGTAPETAPATPPAAPAQ
jgi:cytoskeletal protein RodZ